MTKHPEPALDEKGLLPCPHCGEKEQLYPAYRLDKIGKCIEPPYAIDCLGCGADFTPREGFDARAAWNRRATPAGVRDEPVAENTLLRQAKAYLDDIYNPEDDALYALRSQIKAALARPAPQAPVEHTVLDDDSLRAQIGSIGNEVHNLSCRYQYHEALSEALADIRSRLWNLAQQAPATPPAPVPTDCVLVPRIEIERVIEIANRNEQSPEGDRLAVRLSALSPPPPSGVVEALRSLTTAVSNLRVPRNMAEAAMQVMVTIGPAFEQASAAIAGLQGQESGWRPTHRHKLSGGKYRFEGWAEIQSKRPLVDYDKVAVYRAEDGKTWVRPVGEFEDGRFEILPASPKQETK